MSNIIESKRVLWTYVISKDEDLSNNLNIPYEENIVNTILLDSELYKNDTKLVYYIILRNFSNNSNI